MTRIISDPEIMLGKPTIAGTRITVEHILRLLSQKLSIQAILEDFPQLTETDIKAAVNFASKLVDKPDPRALKYWHEVSNGRKSRVSHSSKTPKTRI